MPTSGLENTSGYKSFIATGTAIPAYTRVTVNASGQITAAAATDITIGVTMEYIASNGIGNVKLFSAPGSFMMTASAAITAGTQLYPTASGRVAGTGTTALNLVALDAATAAGDVIEALPMNKGA